MPISYSPGTVWPPAEAALAAPYYREWLTWYRGKPEELFKHYQGRSLVQPRTRPSQLAGGVQGFFARAFWGRPITTGAARVHLPTAADVSSLSAGLLFADPPQPFFAADTRTQQLTDRLARIVDDAQLNALLYSAGERQSAAGGVYVRASANIDAADCPIAEAILPDRGVPEFYGPWLTAVTFWRQVGERTENGPRLLHLERHEMERGVCVVYHALYSGRDGKLGKLVPLTEAPETARFAELVDEQGRIVIGTSKLDVVYIPNLQPHPDPLIEGTPLGRSDYEGATDVMDGADEIWTSLMRDFKLAKARLVVPRGYIQRVAGEGGAGGYFDPEREIYSAINAQPGNADSSQLMIEKVQFDIRVEQHLRGLDEAWRVILKRAGLDGNENQSEATPETATATNAKQSRKRTTRNVKIRLWDPNIRRLLFVMLELDALYFRGPAARPVELEWPDASAPDAETVARTVQLLDAAGAVSDRTKVAMVHPDWDDEKIEAEVALIKSDAPPPPDPADPNLPQDVENPVDDDDEDQT